MKLQLFLLFASCAITIAQIPLTIDMEVTGKMHMAIQAEMAMLLEMEVVAANAEEAAYKYAVAAEIEVENKLLEERGSLVDASGAPIPGNENIGEQIIDPRTPAGFGDPFFRKIHVEINQEINMSPQMADAIAETNTTTDIAFEDFVDICENVTHCLDLDRDGQNDLAKSWEGYFVTEITFNSEAYSEKISGIANLSIYYNGTENDFVGNEKCVTTNNMTTCDWSNTTHNSYWDAEVALFPNGICPHACMCVAGTAATVLAGQKLIEKCYDSCAGNTLVDQLNCKMLMNTGEKVRNNIKCLLDDFMPGWGPGLLMKRSHPLGGEIRRFIGVF